MDKQRKSLLKQEIERRKDEIFYAVENSHAFARLRILAETLKGKPFKLYISQDELVKKVTPKKLAKGEDDTAPKKAEKKTAKK